MVENEPSVVKCGWIDTYVVDPFPVLRGKRCLPLSIPQRARREAPWGLYADREFHTTLGPAGLINFLDLENPDFGVSYRTYCLKAAIIESSICGKECWMRGEALYSW
jgi:hypothetical protein